MSNNSYGLILTGEQILLLKDIMRKEVLKQSSLIDISLVDEYSDIENENDKKKHEVGKHIETGKIYRTITNLVSEWDIHQ
jgi:hypothetical protein